MTAPGAGSNGERVFIRLGPPPEEPHQFVVEGAPRSYSPEVQARLEVDAKEIIGRYPNKRSALLPLLHLVQSEDSYITPAGMEFCATQLGLTGAEVSAVASFYSMYRRGPTGDYLVGVCTNTPDGAVTLQHIECNAACDFAPVMMVNWEFYDNQTTESARELIDSLRAGSPKAPTRGAAPLCSFREASRILAGLPDERPDEGQGGAGAATLAGLAVAKEHGMQAPTAPEGQS